ncbi:iron chelate uptake ABC transporter family permease subunit [Poseidonocella sp. HB161398]|uniref:FecCD family ABC transporter permease n=1 Tax=Poseidonocella sp. HB161398 TaxID=2320855 RepID=UPI0011083F56|nr:iron chelate uptake ABC transporter family permease subunit [Poseidonocella sp. HB161398]
MNTAAFSLPPRLPGRVALANAALALLCLALALWALSLGRMEIGPADLLALIAGENTPQARVLGGIRLPRMVTAAAAGAALGISGAVIQSVARNPLGSPDIVGLTTGAATGALVQILLQGPSALGTSLAAIGGGLATAGLVYLLARRDGVVGSARLVLAGVGTGAVLAALNGLMLVQGALDEAMSAALWLAGSLAARSWMHAAPVAIGVLCLAPPLLWGARSLSLIEMGDDTARALGIRVEATRVAMAAAAVALAAIATGAAGPIPFIALAAPQIARRLGGSGQVPVLGAGLTGAALVLGGDLVTQAAAPAVNLPIGQIAGILGGLYLLGLLATRPR